MEDSLALTRRLKELWLELGVEHFVEKCKFSFFWVLGEETDTTDLSFSKSIAD